MLNIYTKAKFLNYLILYNWQLSWIIQQKSLLGFLHYKKNYYKVFNSTANVLKFFHNNWWRCCGVAHWASNCHSPLFHWRLPRGAGAKQQPLPLAHHLQIFAPEGGTEEKANTPEFIFRKKRSPIWSVKTSFCQKRYESQYDDWSLERYL